MRKFRNFKLFLSFVLVMSLFFTSGSMAFAHEANNSNYNLRQDVTTSTETLASVNPVAPCINSYGRGRWYLGNFAFTDTNTGNAFLLSGSRVKICVAFKKADSQASDVDLEVNLAKIEYLDGKEYYHYRGGERFMSANDDPDSDGYVYFESDWIDIYSHESGGAFVLKYEVFTAWYQSGISPRRADVHVWLDVE